MSQQRREEEARTAWWAGWLGLAVALALSALWVSFWLAIL